MSLRNINQDIKETIRLSALERLAMYAGIDPQQVESAQRIITVSNQDAMEKEMEQGSGMPMTMPPASPPPSQPKPSNPERMAGVQAVQGALRTESPLDNLAMMKMRQARGGGMAYKGYSGMVPVKGHGIQDNVYMPIVERNQGKQVATLAVSPDEYIVDAGTVAALGNGSSDAGARVLDETIKDIRQEAYGTTKQQNQINGLASLQQAIQSNIG